MRSLSLAKMMTKRTGEQELADWLDGVDADDHPELHTFATEIRQNRRAHPALQLWPDLFCRAVDNVVVPTEEHVRFAVAVAQEVLQLRLLNTSSSSAVPLGRYLQR